jgi:hypothetical protein
LRAMADLDRSHTHEVTSLLKVAAAEHVILLTHLPGDIARSLPVDAQGIQHAIDHLAMAAGFSDEQRRRLILPHAANPAVLHARVFGAEGLTDSTVIGAFVEGARVRADALGVLADEVGGRDLGARVRLLLTEKPPPIESDPDATEALVTTYKAQERAAMLIAGALDTQAGPRLFP